MADFSPATKGETPQTIRIAVGSTNPCKIEAVRTAFQEVFGRSNLADGDGIDADNGASPTVRLKLEISSYNVPSGVPDQPFGDDETREGATNRARAAYDAAVRAAGEDASLYPDFAVGLEGGLEKMYHKQSSLQTDNKDKTQQQTEELWCMAWMAILGSNNSTCTYGKASGSTYVSSKKNNATDPTSEEGSGNPNINGKCQQMTWGYAKTATFLLPPALCDLVLHQNMELGHADDIVFKRVNSKHGGGTVGKLTDGEIDRMEYYVHCLKLALIPWIRPELYLD